MVVIIGAGTTVTSDVISGGFVSVNFSLSPNVERLFQLGSFDAFDINITGTEKNGTDTLRLPHLGREHRAILRLRWIDLPNLQNRCN